MANPNPERIYNARNATEYVDIANYVSTVRTNSDLQSKGIQTTAFVTDSAGVPTAYSSNLLQFNGDYRHVDTGWTPSPNEDWSFEIIQNFINDGVDHINGTAATSFVSIGESNANAVHIYVAPLNLSSPPLVGIGLKHIVLTYNSATNLVQAYINGVATLNGVNNFTAPTESFILGIRGKTALGFPLKSQLALPRYHRKTFTATEVATAYAQAKTIYPTLP